jgi:signal transduction histidine kinase
MSDASDSTSGQGGEDGALRDVQTRDAQETAHKLQQELQDMRARLHTNEAEIESLRAANAELRAANQELRTINSEFSRKFVSPAPGNTNDNAAAERADAGRLRLTSEMAATLAHELNQPLTAAATYLKVARRQIIGDGQKPDIASTLDKAAAQMLRAGEIIGRLREFLGRDEPDGTA